MTSSHGAATRSRARATKMSPTPALFSLPEARTRFTISSEDYRNLRIQSFVDEFSSFWPGFSHYLKNQVSLYTLNSFLSFFN
ncbi:hypothetical protein U0070_026493 [Myodes glareolus]|uniref:Uncharacterized protein n=1 Tax=Myodes glareolus TaxID=447135 RepID=A0AAW0JJP0_MYOGA